MDRVNRRITAAISDSHASVPPYNASVYDSEIDWLEDCVHRAKLAPFREELLGLLEAWQEGEIRISEPLRRVEELIDDEVLEPDVLIVHNLGYFRSSFSARVGSVLKMYTDGYPYADWGSNPPLADHRLMLKPMGAHIGTGAATFGWPPCSRTAAAPCV